MPHILYTDENGVEKEVPISEPTKPLLTQLLNAGIDHSFHCRFGQCGVCRIGVEKREEILDCLHILEGTVERHPQDQLYTCSTWIDESHREDGDLVIRLKKL